VKQTSKVALCGVLSALSVMLMLLTVIPIATYALPAMAGAVLIPIVVEAGPRWGWMSYAAVALLCLLIGPEPEAKVLFVTFFGYYPVLKAQLERLHKRWVEWVIKLAVFNVAIVGSYLLMTFVLHLPMDFDLFGLDIRVFLLGMLIAGNVVFVIYDLALTNVITAYWVRLHPKLTRLFRH
jgi:MFS family permease